jgi:hypothetical protein
VRGLDRGDDTGPVTAGSGNGAASTPERNEPTVFVNYRGADEPWAAILIDRTLTARYGPTAVFLDSRSILPGEEYPGMLLAGVRRSSVLVAVMGIRWLVGLEREDDWTRREIAEAFICGVRVLPVLVGELRPLRPEDLPADIAALARCQYLPLRHRDASHDLTRIVATIAYLEPELELRRKDGPRQELAG